MDGLNGKAFLDFLTLWLEFFDNPLLISLLLEQGLIKCHRFLENILLHETTPDIIGPLFRSNFGSLILFFWLVNFFILGLLEYEENALHNIYHLIVDNDLVISLIFFLHLSLEVVI